MRSRSPRPARWSAASVALLVLAASVPVLAPAAQAAPPLPPVFVTEIAPNSAGGDDFEFIELTNTTDAPIGVGSGSGTTVAYTYVDSDDRSRDVALRIPEGTAVPAHGSLVLWLSYESSTVNSFARSFDEFRTHWATVGSPAAAYPLERAEGQPGMANGGGRGVRIVGADDRTISWSYYPEGSVATDETAHFRVDDDGDVGTALLAGPATATPGAVDAAAFTVPEPEPEPDRADTAALLQITELLPDTSNVGGADGYEFIELHNPTTDPVDWAHHTLDYLYPGADLVNTSVVEWPTTPAPVVVPAGETLVIWVKNGANDHLTADDFNTKFDTALVAGVDLVEVFQGGMANGSARGLEVVTNTGFSLNKAYYNLDGDDTTADQGIQYAPSADDPGIQRLVGIAPASPGSVTPDQLPAQPVVPPADAAAPELIDHTAAEVTAREAFTIDVAVTDDVLVRTVSLELRSNVDGETTSHNLETDGSDRYRHVIEAVDLTGKRWIEYRVTASDGTSEVTTGVQRVPVGGVDERPLRLNVDDGQLLAGGARIAAATDTYPAEVELAIDGTAVSPTAPSLEDEPVFAFEATSTDAFFRNGVLIGEDVLHVFDEGFYADEVTVATPVPLRYVEPGRDLTVSVYAGTKAWPAIDPDENNDDFQIRNIRLVLPDGRTLRPAGYEDATEWLRMGDSAGKLDFFDASFAPPADAFTAVAHAWDTTVVPDGPHTVTASSGDHTAEATVTVDNTAPEIATELVDGRQYQGPIAIDAEATDLPAGVESLRAELDGEAVALPHRTSSVDLPAGEHTVVFTATDTLGNARTLEISFTTPEEQPTGTPLSPVDGDVSGDDDVVLEARVEDPTDDPMHVELREGRRLDATDVRAYQGTTGVAAGDDRSAAEPLDGDDLAAMVGDDGVDTEVTSDTAFPYQLFEVDTGDAGADGLVRVAWDGRANADAKVLLYVRNTATGTWEELDRALTTGGAPTDITLEGVVPVRDHEEAGTLTVLIQHSEGFAGEDRSSRETTVGQEHPAHPEDEPRDSYDFTLGWESDTQYYNETFYERQLDIHEYFLDRRDDLNLQYVIHTGDIVDEYDQEAQWLNADPAYAMLDEAGLPYGVLAGNHDVGGALEDYSEYSRWFGEARFADNPWYGDGYQGNRGHYDLVTAGGLDFVFVYQGWGPGDEEIAWMNDVLARYPERKAVILLHEYMLTAGGLGPIPQQIQDEVVATNPNVVMVGSGHYHDAFTRWDGFDDDGDGADDRQVLQMLFDYQGLPEGGQAFLRLLHFDNQDERLMVRTYSPYLRRYESEDPRLDPEHQTFDVAYADLGLEPRTKVLATDDLRIEVLGDQVIAAFEDVASGETVQAWWYDRADGDHGWYVVTSDPHGAVHRSPVVTFMVDQPGSGDPKPDRPKNARAGDGRDRRRGGGGAGGAER